MNAEPIQKRRYQIFLSHSSLDKKTVVNQMYEWLSEVADIEVWYDREVLTGGAGFVKVLAEAIPLCRSMVIVLSQASVKSMWVEQEYSLALNHQAEFRDFKIIPVLIDDCEVPGFLQNTNYIRIEKSELTLQFYDQLLRALYPGDLILDPQRSSDIYVSRTWRDNEAKSADEICLMFADARFRLIGDSKDHPHFKDDNERVDNIISSCGGLLAILPYREESGDSGFTSPYMLQEIYFAQKYKLPCIIFCDSGVVLPDDIKKIAVKIVELLPDEAINKDKVKSTVDILRDKWKVPTKPHQIFFATGFEDAVRNQVLQKTIQRITAMACVMGENVRQSDTSVQKAIINRIRNAFFVIGDISNDNINTLIEMGAARGANVDYYLIAREPRHKPPFMFRDIQVFYYSDDIKLLGLVHSLVHKFRRKVLNYELKR